MKTKNMMQNWKKNMKFDKNVTTAMAGALKRLGGPLHDNLIDLLEKKTSWLEGLKRYGAHMWKIIVGDPRQNHCGGRNLSAAAPEGILEILRT